jgi:hypothetical protein
MRFARPEATARGVLNCSTAVDGLRGSLLDSYRRITLEKMISYGRKSEDL